MQRDKLNQIISEENEERERTATRGGRSLILEITEQKARIRTAEEKIADLRKQLQELSVETVSEADVLGGE